jgi:hypothetical protein
MPPRLVFTTSQDNVVETHPTGYDNWFKFPFPGMAAATLEARVALPEPT